MSDNRTVDNVIQPERFRRRRDPEGRAAALEKRRKREAEQRQWDLLKLRRIENGAGYGKKGPVFNLSDRIEAALANGELVERARERGIGIAEIDERFGGRSDRYRLAPGVDHSTSEARKKAGHRLMQKARGYLRLARAVAKLTGENADDNALRVMQGTALWRSSGNGGNDDAVDERADRLQELIHAMSRAVIRKGKLEKAFATLAKIPDSHCNPFARRFEGVDINRFADYDASGLLPGVRLTRLSVAELPVTAYPVERTKTGVSGGETFGAALRLSLDIRLVIGPRTAPTNLGPMFESRPHVELRPASDVDDKGEGSAYAIAPDSHLEFDVWKETFLDEADAVEPDTGDDVLWTPAAFFMKADEEERVREFYLKATECVRLIGDADDPPGERFANLYWREWPRVSNALEFDPRKCWRWEDISRRPVDADHVSALLDWEAPHMHYHNFQHHYGIVALSTAMDSVCARCFPRGTVAFDVESRLETGDLERALLLDSERIDRYIRKWREELDNRDSRLFAGWSDDAGDPE